MSKRRRLWILLLVSWLCSAVAHPEPLPAHRAEYLLTRDGLPFATMVMELERAANGGYHYRSSTRPHKALELVNMALDIAPGAHMSEQSAGKVVNGQFRPDRYRFRRDNADRRELTVTFDWEKGRAEMASSEQPWSMEVPAGTLDKLTVLLALRQDLAAGSQDLTYPVADGGKLKSYRYRVAGPQQVTISDRAWESIEVTRSKQEGPTDYRIWLAAKLRYLPVLVEREEDGALFRMELTATEDIDAGETMATGD
ncbi:MAG: DUF3108 domain-containing protein [Pseudomonadota bacterium]|nr:DUF3108 domain-containing protein [Pseudomonadota bacterium]